MIAEPPARIGKYAPGKGKTKARGAVKRKYPGIGKGKKKSDGGGERRAERQFQAGYEA